MYEIEVRVKQISIEKLLSAYWKPDPRGEGCVGCPSFGKVWSCPPALPPADRYLSQFDGMFLIGVKVSYPEKERNLAQSPGKAEELRECGYEKVAKELLLVLLELEGQVPGGLCMGAGRCRLCSRCAREEEKPCRHPDLLRYSITGFGFDFARLLKEQLEIELLWNPNGLPEYDVVTAALFYQKSA